MANQIDGGKQEDGAISGIDQEQRTLREKALAKEKKAAGGRDDTLDADLEQQRLEPGLSGEGQGGAGGELGRAGKGNSNS